MLVPQIETERLLLRPFVREDIPDLQEMALWNPKDNTQPHPALHHFERTIVQISEGSALNWGITLKPENRIIGSCGYYRGFENKTGEIGYYLNAAYRGKGILSEAARAVIDHGFDILRLQTICAYTAPDNTASQTLLKRLGFRLDDPEPDEEGYIRFLVFK